MNEQKYQQKNNKKGWVSKSYFWEKEEEHLLQTDRYQILMQLHKTYFDSQQSEILRLQKLNYRIDNMIIKENQ